MKFTINAAPPPDKKKCDGVLKLESACRALKDGELVTMEKLASIVDQSYYTARDHVRRMDKTLRIKDGRQFLYGNTKTITAYRKQIQD